MLNRWEHSQFLRFRNQYGTSIIKNHRRHPQPEEYRDVPTFGEFVQYLITTPVWEYNEHWRPYYLTCIPCHQRYSIIIKLDSIAQETKYLVHITGLQELSPRHAHVTINTTYNRSSSAHKQKKFKLSDFQVQLLHRGDQASGSATATESMLFSELDMQQLMKLYSIYKIDFEMFNYEISPYDTYVNMNKKF